MPRRRRDGSFFDELFELLVLVPWWVGPILAIVFFVGLRFLVPALNFESAEVWTLVFVPLSRVAAYAIAGITLFLSVLAQIRKWSRRRLLDAQSGLESVRNLSWQEFEHLVGEAFRRQGYVVEETGLAGGDGGIDLSLSRSGERVLVQCKRWRSWRVGVKPVRELFGVMTAEGADRAILACCGSFTKEAMRFAEGKPLDLMDGERLSALVLAAQATGSSVKPEPAVTEAPAPAAALDSSSLRTPEAPSCPRCKATMVLRTAQKGPRAGSRFWGCPAFPKCRGTRELSQASAGQDGKGTK